MFSCDPRNGAIDALALDITPKRSSYDGDASVAELAYFAGLFDGEGCISISRNRSSAGYDRFQLVVLVQMADREGLEGLQAIWGGRVRQASAQGERNKATFSWVVESGKAAQFLAAIEPYVRLERIRAKIVLAVAFQEQKAPRGGLGAIPADSYRTRQRLYWEQMRMLNRRGPTLSSCEGLG